LKKIHKKSGTLFGKTGISEIKPGIPEISGKN
jgi:hypothetical protein